MGPMKVQTWQQNEKPVHNPPEATLGSLLTLLGLPHPTNALLLRQWEHRLGNYVLMFAMLLVFSSRRPFRCHNTHADAVVNAVAR